MILNKIHINNPLNIDWETEIKKKGEISVPLSIEEATDFIKVRIRKSGNGNPKARRIQIFPSPSLKKGMNLGKSISAYENKRVNAPR